MYSWIAFSASKLAKGCDEGEHAVLMAWSSPRTPVESSSRNGDSANSSGSYKMARGAPSGTTNRAFECVNSSTGVLTGVHSDVAIVVGMAIWRIRGAAVDVVNIS